MRALSDLQTDCRRSPCPTGGLAAGPRQPAAKRVVSARSRACPSPGKTRRQAGQTGPVGQAARKIKTKLSLSLLTGGWVERGGVVVAHVAGRPSQREIPAASLLVRPAQPVTVVTGLFLLLLPGYFSCLGPVDGAETAEKRKKNLRKFDWGVSKKRGVGKKFKFVLCPQFFCCFFCHKKGRRKKILAHPRIPFLSSL